MLFDDGRDVLEKEKESGPGYTLTDASLHRDLAQLAGVSREVANQLQEHEIYSLEHLVLSSEDKLRYIDGVSFGLAARIQSEAEEIVGDPKEVRERLYD